MKKAIKNVLVAGVRAKYPQLLAAYPNAMRLIFEDFSKGEVEAIFDEACKNLKTDEEKKLLLLEICFSSLDELSSQPDFFQKLETRILDIKKKYFEKKYSRQKRTPTPEPDMGSSKEPNLSL